MKTKTKQKQKKQKPEFVCGSCGSHDYRQLTVMNISEHDGKRIERHRVQCRCGQVGILRREA